MSFNRISQSYQLALMLLKATLLADARCCPSLYPSLLPSLLPSLPPHPTFSSPSPTSTLSSLPPHSPPPILFHCPSSPHHSLSLSPLITHSPFLPSSLTLPFSPDHSLSAPPLHSRSSITLFVFET
ncbi:unnamed protein product, partial [Closterium sp. Naga37s-1]